MKNNVQSDPMYCPPVSPSGTLSLIPAPLTPTLRKAMGWDILARAGLRTHHMQFPRSSHPGHHIPLQVHLVGKSCLRLEVSPWPALGRRSLSSLSISTLLFSRPVEGHGLALIPRKVLPDPLLLPQPCVPGPARGWNVGTAAAIPFQSVKSSCHALHLGLC